MLKSLTEKAASVASRIFGGSASSKKNKASAKRKGDFVIIVCQRNDIKRLEIRAVDSETEKIVGYNSDYLTRRTLNDILPPDVNDTIDNYIEFENDGNDLASVLNKIRDFAIIIKDGRRLPVNIRVVGATAYNDNPCFSLIMSAVGLHKALEASRQQIYSDLEKNQIIDEAVGLLSRESFIQDLDLVRFFVQKTNAKAMCVIIAIDNFSEIDAKHGSNTGNKVINEVGGTCIGMLREEDVVGYLGQNLVGAILLDAGPERAKIPLNRIRGNFNTRKLKYENSDSISLSLTVVYTVIAKNDKPEHIMSRCEKEIYEASDSTGKSDLILV